MSFTDFKIQFDNQYGIFFSGQEVSGCLSFRLSNEKRMRGVEITFEGMANVYWTESRSTTDSEGRSTTVTDTYSNREKYFDQSLYVIGGSNQDMTLQPGSYSFPFRYILPYNIPASFEGAHGYVRYVVKGRINRPWRFDHKCKTAFTVLCPLDLNNEFNIQEPFQTVKEKVLCCGCCSSDAITLVVSLPFRGFVPGQQSNAVVEVDNPTSESITAKCNLIQTVTFKASGGRTNVSAKTIERETLGTLQGRGSLSRRSYLKIPAVPVSFLRFCNCIDITYVFQVRGELSGMHRNPTIDVPITVGTIPLRNQFAFIVTPEPQAPSAPQLPPAGPGQQPGDQDAPPPYPSYPDMPPPSYAECMSGKANIRSNEDDEYLHGEMEFAPRYPVYHFK